MAQIHAEAGDIACPVILKSSGKDSIVLERVTRLMRTWESAGVELRVWGYRQNGRFLIKIAYSQRTTPQLVISFPAAYMMLILNQCAAVSAEVTTHYSMGDVMLNFSVKEAV